MGQYFRLVDLDGQAGFYLGKLGEGVWSLNLHRLLLPYMVKYLKPLDEIRREVFASARVPPMNEQKQSPLLAMLPADVLGLIFDRFGATDDGSAGIDAACFALACQMTFDVGYTVLRKHHNATPQTWAGHRLILAGDYQDPQDVPTCLAHVMPPEWMEPKTNIYNETKDWPQGWKVLREVVEREVFQIRRRAPRSRKEREAVDHLEDLWRNLFGIRTPPSMANPVLRNLNTREYAREDALEDAQEFHEEGRPSYFHRGFKDLRIGDLAVFRLCWTSDHTLGIEGDEERISRGPWAGHRFDIVDVSQVEHDEDWKDISFELVDEVAEIYRANFPADRHYLI